MRGAGSGGRVQGGAEPGDKWAGELTGHNYTQRAFTPTIMSGLGEIYQETVGKKANAFALVTMGETG